MSQRRILSSARDARLFQAAKLKRQVKKAIAESPIIKSIQARTAEITGTKRTPDEKFSREGDARL